MTSEYLTFWGKAEGSAEAESQETHPAAFHMLDVAAVALAWLEHTKGRVPGLEYADGATNRVIALLVGLHDIGKFSRPFQGKRPDLWPNILGPYAAQAAVPRHDSAGFLLLDRDLPAPVKRLLPGLTASERAQIWRAVCGHHGRPPDSDSPLYRQAVCNTCRSSAHAFVQDFVGLLAPAPLPEFAEEDVTTFSWWLAGLTVLADWIGSNALWFGSDREHGSLSAYWPKARACAAEAIRRAGVLPIPPAADFGIKTLLPSGGSATPLQQKAAEIDLGEPAAPTLILIEDQTGSGKTEAALLIAERLMVEKSARGVFIALPTMATANALYGRLSSLYRTLFREGEESPSLVLAHGKRRLHERFMASVVEVGVASSIKGDADETASEQCAGWIAADRRRAFLADCGVGTIDQALMAVLPTRHAPLRLFGLKDRVLVIDEAHAYDTYMREELVRLVEFQTKLGGHTVILSATLPKRQRETLVTRFRAASGYDPVALAEMRYPLITIASSSRLAEEICAPRRDLGRNIVVERLSSVDDAIAEIAAATARGAAVAWLRNTVDEAIEAQVRLTGHGIRARLFHARFAMGDRLAIETEVLSRFGKASAYPARSGVIVGTQVMEQSLDIDFDLMITDLAPVDLLLQRAGRLWRHQRTDRPFATPRLLVLSPPPVDEPAGDWLAMMRGTAAVYRDPGLLWRSARYLFRRSTLKLPGDVRDLVEAVYGDTAIPAGLQAASERQEGVQNAAAAMAWINLLEWRGGYAQANGAWVSEARTPTRLSDPSVVVRLARWEDGVLRPWCDAGEESKRWQLSEVALPARKVSPKGWPDSEDTAGAALRDVRATWSRFDQDVAVLILRPEAEGWIGSAHDPKGRPVRIGYREGQGIWFV